jgi:hypothetical protein
VLALKREFYPSGEEPRLRSECSSYLVKNSLDRHQYLKQQTNTKKTGTSAKEA